MSETDRPYRTEIYRRAGDTPRSIRVSVDPGGDVLLSSQDFTSPALRPFAGGASEYEYDTRVPAEAKDRLLLALLAERYQGNPNAVEAFRGVVRGKRHPLPLLHLGQ